MTYLINRADARTSLKQKFGRLAVCQRLVLGLLLSFSSSCPLFGQSTAGDNLKLGVSLVNSSPGEAIHYLTRAINLDPTSATACRQRAKALGQAGNAVAAEADLQRAIELDPKFAPDHVLLASLQRSKGHLEAAILSLNRALELDPKNALTYFERGRIKEQQQDLDGSAADYTRAIEADTDHINSGLYYECRGDLKKRSGDLDGAISDYGKSIEYTRPNTFYVMEPSFKRGSALYMKQAWKEALEDFHRAAKQCRNRLSYGPKIHFWLVRTRMGEPKEADAELAESMNADSRAKSDDKLIRFILGQTSEAKLFADAATSTDKTDQSNLDSVHWYYSGVKRLMAGDKTGAIDCFKKSVAVEPQQPQAEYDWAKWELKILSPQ